MGNCSRCDAVSLITQLRHPVLARFLGLHVQTLARALGVTVDELLREEP